MPDGYAPVPGLDGGWEPSGDGVFDPFADAEALDLDALGPLTVLELDEPSLYSPAEEEIAPRPAHGPDAPGGADTEVSSLLADLGDLDDSLDSVARHLLDLPAETDPPQEDRT
ncbi:hypothetical protein G3I38_11390 [Streptomyces sp. SID7958]|uniref:Uncharacterized protein n=2 Tax=unclassified Streptomyces TaxID=2593676 RepID=A0A6G3QTF1_9ACTN|nr:MULTISPECIES: hypothetical protein [unclassified Streptomyces]NEA86612.1 hypothetical protein [Streptomyces sp. SID14436]NEC79833.1 hypothetical protein [Streptomyces sp. SID7958]